MTGTWTDARIATLERMWADGTPAAAIGDALGVTRNAVIGKARRLDLDARAPRGNSRHNWRRLNVKMRALWDDGLPTTHIARKLGIAECTARKALRALDLPSRGKSNSHGRGSLLPPVHRSAGAGGPLREAPATSSRAGRVMPAPPDLAPVAANAIGAPFGDAVSLDALTPFTCRWPLGGEREPATYFCGATCPAAVPYCEHHTAVATNAYHSPRRMMSAPTSLRMSLQGYGHADRFLGGDA